MSSLNAFGFFGLFGIVRDVKGSVPLRFGDYAARIESEFLYRRDLERSDLPLVSIITPTLNSAKTLQRAIDSLRAQDYANIEHVVIDGLSSDATMEIVMASREGMGAILRGRDVSPADAANKGVVAARGKYVAVLPSDDYLGLEYIQNCVDALERSGADFVFGDLIYVEEGLAPMLIPGDPNYERHILNVMPNIGSTTIMYRRECFEKIGLWDIGNPYCPDYDWLLRAHLAGLKGAYSAAIRSYFCYGGVSSVNFNKSLAAARDVSIAHGGNVFRANFLYYRSVAQKHAREILRAVLPESLFFRIWYLVSRTGTRPFSNNH